MGLGLDRDSGSGWDCGWIGEVGRGKGNFH